MKYSPAILILLFLHLSSVQFAQVRDISRYASMVSQEKQKGILSFLADDSLEGRATNSIGSLMTISMATSLFKQWNMIPFYSQTFVQSFKKDSLIGRNVAGVVLSSGYSEDYIVVSAHYDHLGKIGERIYNGADDNASGVTVLLTLAELFSNVRTEMPGLKKNILFVLMDEKEHNMAGSKEFLKRLPVPAKNIVCNINIDQIGTTFAPPGKDSSYMIVLGTAGNNGFIKKRLDAAKKFYGFDMDINYSYYGSASFSELFYKTSDQYSFALKKIPSVLVTSGIHMHTYKTTDDYQFINYPVLAKRTQLLFYLIYNLSEAN